MKTFAIIDIQSRRPVAIDFNTIRQIITWCIIRRILPEDLLLAEINDEEINILGTLKNYV